MREIGAWSSSEPCALLRFPRESGGPGAAMAPLPRSGPQRSGLSDNTLLGVFSKDGTLRAAAAVAGWWPSGCPPALGGPRVPAVPGQTASQQGDGTVDT